MLNNVTLMGRLAQTPEIKTTQNGISVTKFDLAVPVPSADRNAPPDYIPVVCWDKQADFVGKYLSKGRQVVLAGEIKTHKYTDKDGKTRKAVEVVAHRVYFADSKDASGADEATEAPVAPTLHGPVAPTFQEVGNDDELPF